MRGAVGIERGGDRQGPDLERLAATLWERNRWEALPLSTNAKLTRKVALVASRAASNGLSGRAVAREKPGKNRAAVKSRQRYNKRRLRDMMNVTT